MWKRDFHFIVYGVGMGMGNRQRRLNNEHTLAWNWKFNVNNVFHCFLLSVIWFVGSDFNLFLLFFSSTFADWYETGNYIHKTPYDMMRFGNFRKLFNVKHCFNYINELNSIIFQSLVLFIRSFYILKFSGVWPEPMNFLPPVSYSAPSTGESDISCWMSIKYENVMPERCFRVFSFLFWQFSNTGRWTHANGVWNIQNLILNVAKIGGKWFLLKFIIHLLRYFCSMKNLMVFTFCSFFEFIQFHWLISKQKPVDMTR